MIYTRTTNSKTYGNPRYLFECPSNLTIKDAKELFGFKRATDGQTINLQTANGRINLILIITTYNIDEIVQKLSKYEFYSDRS